MGCWKLAYCLSKGCVHRHVCEQQAPQLSPAVLAACMGRKSAPQAPPSKSLLRAPFLFCLCPCVKCCLRVLAASKMFKCLTACPPLLQGGWETQIQSLWADQLTNSLVHWECQVVGSTTRCEPFLHSLWQHPPKELAAQTSKGTSSFWQHQHQLKVVQKGLNVCTSVSSE